MTGFHIRRAVNLATVFLLAFLAPIVTAQTHIANVELR